MADVAPRVSGRVSTGLIDEQKNRSALRVDFPHSPAAVPSGRVDVLGVGITPTDLSGAVATIAGWIHEQHREYVCVTGVHGVMESQRAAELRDIHNRSGMTTADGKPMVWASRYAGAEAVGHVRGSDLMAATCAEAERRGWRIYLYGGGDGVGEQLAASLVGRFPKLQIAGRETPPFRALTRDEEDAVAARINAARPDIVWVGLSTPKQERWMAEFRPRLAVPVLVGVGAAFDMLAGLVSQSPEWVSKAGLEWAYRLYKEPRRLWRRYARNNPAFVGGVLRQPPHLVGS